VFMEIIVMWREKLSGEISEIQWWK